MLSQQNLEYLEAIKNIYRFANKSEYKNYEERFSAPQIVERFAYFDDTGLVMVKMTNIINNTPVYPNRLYLDDRNEKLISGYFLLPHRSSTKHDTIKRLKSCNQPFFDVIGTANTKEYHLGYAKLNKIGEEIDINGRNETICTFDIISPFNSETPDQISKKRTRNEISRLTMYNERLFDSCLESKWAYFLDLCGFKHRKAAAYDDICLYDDIRQTTYTPDFNIVGHTTELVKNIKGHALIEIKPCAATELAKSKCEDLARKYFGMLVVLICGYPVTPFEVNKEVLNVNDTYRATAFFSMDGSEESVIYDDNMIFVKDGEKIFLDKQLSTKDKRWKDLIPLYNKVKKATFVDEHDYRRLIPNVDN
jgi:hypothetical protein